jgi:hypothetical protein
MVQIKEVTSNNDWRQAYQEKLSNPNLPYQILRLVLDGKLIGSMMWDSTSHMWR